MSAVVDSVARYTAAQVALHDTTSDCWVIVHGAVLDVTSFLQSHPGGVSALSKEGRAGTDVSAHFDRIGHSANAKSIVKALQIGVLADGSDNSDDETASLLASRPMNEDSQVQVEREHAVRWHAERRQAIMKDHPEIADLIGSNSWTCLIGLLTVLVHGYTCIWVQDRPWYYAWIAAYTVGAVCKMYQFAVNHDICHGTAGSWLEQSSLLKHSAMQIMTLPTMGGAMHTYYEFQHIGHHASLGANSLGDVLGVPEDGSVLVPVSDAPKLKRTIKLDSDTIGKMIFFPDSDGDLFAIGNLSFGRILEKWGREKIDVEEKVERNTRQYIELKAKVKDVFNAGTDVLKEFHKYKILKCLSIQLLHISHHATMAIVLYLQTLLLLPVVTIPLFLFPRNATRLINKATRHLNDGKPILTEGMSDDNEFFLVYTMVRIMASVGLHAWVSVGVTWWLLIGHQQGDWSILSVIKGFFYLYLSELFLYGFAMHPFMGYFLGVHRSGGVGFESKKQTQSGDEASHGCQPTMSTYSIFAAVMSLNLTHHVEHHDFPNIPWNRLPAVTRMAPEYYDHLEQSPGFCSTIYRWIHYSGSWGYACH